MWYIVKIIACSGILFGYYYFFLRNKRYHHYNRFYLLTALLLSVALPFIEIPVSAVRLHTVSQIIYLGIEPITTRHWEQLPPALMKPPYDGSLFTLQNMLLVIYTCGVLLLCSFLVNSFLYIKRISKRYPHCVFDGLKFFNTREKGTPFSFFRSVFWNEQLPLDTEAGGQIFRHELFHVKQQHSLDIVLAELLCAFCWFNPFFFLIKKELKAIHEFLADNYAASGSDRYQYAELMLSTYAKNSLDNPRSISNYFFHNHIKRRIAMITKNNQSTYRYWSRLMALPVLAILVGVITVKARQLSAETHPSVSPQSSISNNERVKGQDIVYKEPSKVNQHALRRKSPAGNFEEPGLNLEKVRTLTLDKNNEDVIKLFGQPDRRTLSETDEAWFYGKDGNRLMIHFNISNNKVLSFFYYLAPSDATKTISYDAVKSIKQNNSTYSDIKLHLGSPTEIKLSEATEDWFYRTADSWLQIEFATGKNKVINFFYNQETEKKDAENSSGKNSPTPAG